MGYILRLSDPNLVQADSKFDLSPGCHKNKWSHFSGSTSHFRTYTKVGNTIKFSKVVGIPSLNLLLNTEGVDIFFHWIYVVGGPGSRVGYICYIWKIHSSIFYFTKPLYSSFYYITWNLQTTGATDRCTSTSWVIYHI
jgi:hypothetical protein